MIKKSIEPQKIEFFPLTPKRWEDFETLFGPNGACAGCWCMWWRMNHKEFTASGKEGLKNALRTLVHRGVEAGLLAYADGIPAAWVTVAPRMDYVRLETSQILAPVDDQPVWSMPCFFIHKNYRQTGMMGKLIHAAVEYAQAHGAKIMEAYPYEPQKKMSALSIYTGVASTFRKEGFVEVARRSKQRPVMRKEIG
ncbi:MAG: GNAT family N-acetyltransferase [Anaerolinea sp.]|nr:GNAT family N-acetyltransferase [Anaerolinea sp.]